MTVKPLRPLALLHLWNLVAQTTSIIALFWQLRNSIAQGVSKMLMSIKCPSHFIDVIIGTNASEVLYISPEICCGVGPVWNCRGLIIRN